MLVACKRIAKCLEPDSVERARSVEGVCSFLMTIRSKIVILACGCSLGAD
ncbi:hypothetical protein GGE60_004467 [Rhizobium leucaenae]|uniref:Uncharacterized protein n=1 Tax=Rhizobium leucaenae TaxID=29450 RepID=A0A7W7ELX7_9HYPH|nr:hypothetical protein [Rhizobium leucaenae]